MTLILFWLLFGIMGVLSTYSGFHILAAVCFTFFGGMMGALYVFWKASQVVLLPNVLQQEMKTLEEEIEALRREGKL